MIDPTRNSGMLLGDPTTVEQFGRARINAGSYVRGKGPQIEIYGKKKRRKKIKKIGDFLKPFAQEAANWASTQIGGPHGDAVGSAITHWATRGDEAPPQVMAPNWQTSPPVYRDPATEAAPEPPWYIKYMAPLIVGGGLAVVGLGYAALRR